MKKLTLLGLSFIICFSVFSQRQKMDSVIYPGGQKEVFLYDNNNLVTTYLVYNFSNQWDNSEKHEYLYQGGNKRTTDISFSWNSTTNIYDTISKITYSFDGLGREITSEESTYTTGKWIGKQKITRQYSNINYKLPSEIIYYKFVNNAFVFDFKEKFQFKLVDILEIKTLFSYQNGKWDDLHNAYSLYDYDSKNNLIGERFYFKKFISATEIEWVYEQQIVQAYDALNNLTEWTLNVSDGSKLVIDASVSFTAYNNAFAKNQLILPFFGNPNDESSFNHMLTNVTRTIYNKGALVASIPGIIYYSDENGTITEVTTIDNEELITVYPNPSTGIMYLSKAQNYTVINSQGIQITQGNGTEINLVNQAVGIYILKTENQTIKIIKQ